MTATRPENLARLAALLEALPDRTPRLVSFVLVFAVLLNGCVVGYRKYPREQLSRPFPEKKYEKAYYFVEGLSIAGGHLALHDALELNSPFKVTEEREEAPKEGLYIHAVVRGEPPSVLAVAFGYISLSTLTILPAWSTKDGARIRFDVYRNGVLVKAYSYEVRRNAFLWIGTLPFIWANLLTTSEHDAYEAIAKQFFVDADGNFR